MEVITELSSKRALVTGATGFIGGRLAQRLVEDGWWVRLLVRDPGRVSTPLHAAAELVEGDLRDIAALCCAVRNTTVIFHCAANVRTWDTWDAYYASNVVGVKNLLDAIGRENPGLSRLVHLSTVDVYGYPTAPCGEQCTTGGGAFGYGRSKSLGEALVRENGDALRIPYAILRPCNVIGPGSQFIVRIGDELRRGVMLEIDGGHANAGLLYIDNLVDRMLWAARAASAVGQCFNVRDNYDVSWAMFLEQFRKAIGGKGIIINLPFPVASAIAHGLEGFHRAFLSSREPLLHPLLVYIFGRSCGHSAQKIRAASGNGDRIGFDEAMKRSVQWFLETSASR